MAEELFEKLGYRKSIHDDRIIFVKKWEGDHWEDDDKSYTETIQFFITGEWFPKNSYIREVIGTNEDGCRFEYTDIEPVSVELHKAMNQQIIELERKEV